MKGQEHQLNEANGKDLAEDTNTRSSKGTEKRRERFAGWLGESPGVQILSFASQAAAVITVIVAAFTYFWEAPEREKEKHYQAWQAINTAQGQGGSGGRTEALQDLNDDKQSLVGLTVPNAFLKGIDLGGAELDNATFTGATLIGADLRDASLKDADLQDVIVGDSASDDTRKANLQDANLEGADFRGADLANVNLQGAKFNNAFLSYAELDGAQLQGANLKHTVLANASLIGADLQGANFRDAYMFEAVIGGADLRGAKHLTQQQINDSLGDDETQLPEGLHASSSWYSSPLDEAGPLSPGEYSVEVFDVPFSFRLGEGWANASYETNTAIEIVRQGTDYLGILFTVPTEVYDPQNLSSGNIVQLPNDTIEDTIAWLRDHPYLQSVSKPRKVDVGGVTGTQFEIQIDSLPQEYSREVCDVPCLPLFVDNPERTPLRLFEGGYRIIVLEVQEKTVVIFVDTGKGTPAKAEEVLNTIVWDGVATSTSTPAPDNVGSRGQEREPIQGSNAADLEAAAVEAVGDYYNAADSEDWAYTYKNLDSETQSMFTENEWINKNDWFADEDPVTYQILSVDENSASQEPVAKVTLRLTFEKGPPKIRNTLFVIEDGVWKHRFTEEEIDLFMPELSYEEFVAAKS